MTASFIFLETVRVDSFAVVFVVDVVVKKEERSAFTGEAFTAQLRDRGFSLFRQHAPESPHISAPLVCPIKCDIQNIISCRFNVLCFLLFFFFIT